MTDKVKRIKSLIDKQIEFELLNEKLAFQKNYFDNNDLFTGLVDDLYLSNLENISHLKSTIDIYNSFLMGTEYNELIEVISHDYRNICGIRSSISKSLFDSSDNLEKSMYLVELRDALKKEEIYSDYLEKYKDAKVKKIVR